MKNLLRVIFAGLLSLPVSSCKTSQDSSFTCKADPEHLKAEWFEDNELDLPYYIVHFCRLAGAVVMEGKHKGFIDLLVWRREKDNKPYNARIMENIYSLVFFYTTDRPWNPYFKDAALRKRTEAALAFWCSIQNEEGQFSEYKEQGWNLPATAFATKFMGEALRLLDGTDAIDRDLLEKVYAAQRKAIMFTLKDPAFYEHGKSFSNQFTNVWSGALAYLSLRDDPEMKSELVKRIRESIVDFQSPAGYFYESDGPDWNYNLKTHENNIMMTWPYVAGTDLEPVFREKYERFMTWLSYNALPEPDGKTWYLNGGISTRTAGYKISEHTAFFQQSVPIAEITPLAYPYLATRDEVKEEADKIRASIKAGTLEIDSLELGAFYAYSPYGLLHRNLKITFPTAQQKEEAMAKLPVRTGGPFIEQRTDSRLNATFSFIRQPGYYAIFNSGEVKNKRQAFGLGMLWHPDAGTFIQPRVNHAGTVWGTLTGKEDEKAFESLSFYPDFRLNNAPVKTEPGISRLPGGDLSVSYDLGGGGRKEVIFTKSGISVRIRRPGKITELIPFMHDCTFDLREGSGDGIILKNGTELRLSTKGGKKIAVEEVVSDEFEEPVQCLQIGGEDFLEYRLAF